MMKKILNIIWNALWFVLDPTTPPNNHIDEFSKNYPRWYNFMGCNYPFEENEYESEEEMISEFFDFTDSKGIQNFLDEGEELLLLPTSSYTFRAMIALGGSPRTVEESNKYGTANQEEDVKHWMRNIMQLVRLVAASKGGM